MLHSCSLLQGHGIFGEGITQTAERPLAIEMLIFLPERCDASIPAAS